MEDYTFTNSAGEKFIFFLDEGENFCLNIKFKDELIACFNMNKEEMNGIIEWKKLADKYKGKAATKNMKQDPTPINPPKPPKCINCGLYQGFAGMHTRTCQCPDYLININKLK